ncbi:MAG: acyl carrier protein [Ruminococcaceae bacterium]|nr:acyl carrier protein [Oscillospiraceae bacterium]MBO5006988.1 acyl carrier protein [Clostridia bacterium]
MLEEIKKILVEEFSIDEEKITPQAEFVNDLGINSLELADLVFICEDKFNVTFEEDDLHTFLTVGDVVNYLAEKAN